MTDSAVEPYSIAELALKPDYSGYELSRIYATLAALLRDRDQSCPRCRTMEWNKAMTPASPVLTDAELAQLQRTLARNSIPILANANTVGLWFELLSKLLATITDLKAKLAEVTAERDGAREALYNTMRSLTASEARVRSLENALKDLASRAHGHLANNETSVGT